MTTIQSSLGEGGIAEELASSQRQISIADFFEKNKHMLGFDSGARALVTAVKEAVDNALDATEEAGILPDIYIEISESGDYYTVVVEDNGPGITREQVPKVFGKLLYGSRFHKREQARGQQGIGISAAVLYSQLTSGKPARITSRTKGSAEAEYFELIIDTDDNEPEIQVAETTSWDRPHGTRIELEMEANMRARQQLHTYVQNTAVVNPHARIEMVEPDESFKFERATDQLPDETEEIRPHPHGVELGTVIKMLGATSSHSVSGFLQEEFTRVGRKTARGVLDEFRDRHFGREMAWQTGPRLGGVDVAGTVREAVENKPKSATSEFSKFVADGFDPADGDRVAGVYDYDRLAHHQLADIVAKAAAHAETEFDVLFGTTVQENVVDAVWDLLRSEAESDLYEIIDAATSSQKDDATVAGVAERLATKFLEAEDIRDRARKDTVAAYVERSAEAIEEYEDATFGETARENVTDAIWSRMRRVPDDVPRVKDMAEDRDAASDLLEGMRAADIMAPPTECLSPITADLVEAGLKKEFDADFYAAATRDADVHGGDPFIVEAGIAYGGALEEEGQAEVLRFANRVPLVYQRGACATTDVVKSIGWRNYGLDQPGGSGVPNGPAVIMIHVASTNVPFTSESKDAIANVPAIEDEIELAIREAARELKSYLNKRRSLEKRREKQDVIARILPQMARKLASVTGREEPDISDAMARIMNNVMVEREVEGDSVRLTVENHTGSTADVELTDIVSAEPIDPMDGARVIDMDGEWFVKWQTSIPAGEDAVLEYSTDDEAAFDLNVEGVDDAKLTIDA